MDVRKSLINADDCVLIIVDVQDHFLAKLPSERAERLVHRVGWLMEIAKVLNVPLILTTEQEKRHGGLTTALAERLPRGTEVLDKTVYSLADQPNILGAVRKTERKTAVLVGLETDVCIAQSAIGLMHKGFQTIVLADATDSVGDAHAFGLERVRQAGVLVMGLKGLYYEWIRAVSMCNKMENEHLKRIGQPAGIIL